jgi:hypothetical protein
MATISTTPKPAYVYDIGADTWFPVGGLAQANVVFYEYFATAGQTTFSGADANSISLSYTTGAAQVFLNGALLSPGDDYTATNGTSVVLLSGAALNDVVTIVAFATFNVADTYTQGQVNALLGAAGLNSFLLMGA